MLKWFIGLSIRQSWSCLDLYFTLFAVSAYNLLLCQDKYEGSNENQSFSVPCISKNCDGFGSVFVLAHKQAIGKVAVLPRVRWCYDDDTRDVIFGYSTVEYLHFEKFTHFSKQIPSKKMQHILHT